MVRSTPRLTKNAFGYFFSREDGGFRTVLPHKLFFRDGVLTLTGRVGSGRVRRFV